MVARRDEALKKIKGFGGRSLKKGGSMKDLLKMQEEFQKKMEEVERKYSEETVQVSAGGGAVKVVMSCDYNVLDIDYDEDAASDKEMFKDLLIAAINEALQKVDEKRKEIAQNELSEFALPGLGNLPM